jgi:hypothetical protein
VQDGRTDDGGEAGGRQWGGLLRERGVGDVNAAAGGEGGQRRGAVVGTLAGQGFPGGRIEIPGAEGAELVGGRLEEGDGEGLRGGDQGVCATKPSDTKTGSEAVEDLTEQLGDGGGGWDVGQGNPEGCPIRDVVPNRR